MLVTDREPARDGEQRKTGTARGRRRRLAFQAVFEGVRTVGWTTAHGLRYVATRRKHPDPELRRAVLLRNYLLRMGPLYMKAGQVLATQSGLLSKRATDEFRSFLSDLPPMSARDLRRTLAENLPAPVDEVFAELDWSPLAVGSVAQVHRAVLRDGRTVAVKVVKRGVPERLAASSWLLEKLLVTMSALVPALRRYDMPAHFRELRPLLVGQSDMVAEAARQARVAANFEAHPFLTVPLPISELCSPDVLVMEFLEGVRGQDVDQVDAPRSLLAQRLQDVFYCMVYFHGLFHVDPHPGNILFGTEGRLMLLDFGLVGTLSEDDKWNLSAFYYACVRQEWELAVERFTRAFVARPERLGQTATEYREELAAILRAHFEEQTARWSTMSFFEDATRLLRRHGARVSTGFSLLALGLLTGEGFISQVDPDVNIWDNARRFTDRFSPYLSDELRERFDRELGDQLPRSTRTRQAAAGYLVAPTHLDRFVLPSAFPLIIEEAHGSTIRDIDGNSYVDLSCGYGPHILGYAHPVAVDAIQRAATRGAVNALGNPDELALAECIADAFGAGSKVVLSNSGTEAVLMAFRMARAFTGKDRVAKFEGHYHGFSDQGMVSSWFRYRGSASQPEPVGGSAGAHAPVVSDTLVLQYGERASLRRLAAHAAELACVIIEPMPTALSDYDQAFLAELREVCTRHGVLLVFDEVVTGFRVHYGGAQHLAGVHPDLTCLGKIIGGGLPCGAVVGHAEVVDIARTTTDPFLDVEGRAFVGGTMSGNSITAAAGTAVLRHLRDNPEIYAELRRKTGWLTDALRAHVAEVGIPCNVTGGHSIFSITFDYARPRLVRDRLAGSNVKANFGLAYFMRKQGVYMPELHTMLLSGAHTDSDLGIVSDAFGKSIRDMTSSGFFTV
jgi:glutamate-1-semialdehyde 2,1-aminomutase